MTKLNLKNRLWRHFCDFMAITSPTKRHKAQAQIAQENNKIS